MVINGDTHDAMDAWHCLNSDLRKSLGFVTPFFCHGQRMWKHLSSSTPALYNAIDADVAGRNMRGTVALLKKLDMWKVYEEFVFELDPAFSAMTRAGMPIDKALREESSKQLILKRNEVRQTIEGLAPLEIHTVKPKDGYKREPTDKTGLQLFTFNGIRNTYCSNCDAPSPPKSHFKARPRLQCSICGGKWTPSHAKARKKPNPCLGAGGVAIETNPCSGSHPVERLDGEKRWARVEPFIASQKGILRYMQYRKHSIIYQGRGPDKRPTTDEKAIKILIGRYPDERFYSLVLEDRELKKILGTYIGYAS